MFGLNPYMLMGVAGLWLMTLVGVGYKAHEIGVDATDAKWIKVEMAREQLATKKFNAATQRYIDAEAKNNEQTRAWEKASYERETYIKGVRLANGRLVAAAGGLFDRNGRSAGGGERSPGGIAAGAAGEPADAAAGCRLSSQTSGDLLDYGAETAGFYGELRICHAYATTIEAWRAAHRPKVTP